jgi:uncharacterized protein (TIGR03437 family)
MTTLRSIHPSNRKFVLRNRIVIFTALIAAALISLDLSRGQVVPGRAKVAAVVQNSIPVASVSAASFIGSPATLATNSIVAAFGTQLASGVQAATTQPLPTSLLNTTVTINNVLAPLFFVSPGQVNFLIPPSLHPGDAQVVITSMAANGDQIESRGQIKIASFAPSIFTANANGAGAPAAVTGRINASGQFVFDPLLPFEPDPVNPSQFLPRPIDVGTEERPAFLILFGTGMTNAPAGSVRVIIGGVKLTVTPAAAPGFTGLDQINVPIPVSLRGAGLVDVTLTVNGLPSNTVKVNMAGTSSSSLSISGFSVSDPSLAGQTVTVQGSGFSTTATQNIVRFGSAQARVIAATGTQLTVIVPFGAESGKVVVQTPQGETQSSVIFRVRTSVSGIVQSTGTATAAPAPLEGVTVRLAGTNLTARTNPQGSFIMPDIPPGPSLIEVDGGTANKNPPFPRISLKMTVQSNRDNQFAQPISLQQITGGSGNVGGGPGFAGGGQFSLGSALLLDFQASRKQATADSQPASLQNQAPSKTVVISDRGVSLEVPIGTGVRFPDGKSSGQMQLTVLERSRLPGITLPVGVYSQTIAQITPLGSVFTPGASLSFPNPDLNNLPPGSKVDLYRYDFQTGAFIKRGTATVSPDRSSVVSDGRLVDLASFWFAAAPSAVTTVIGRVIDALGFPIPGAQVTVNGRADRTDVNGSFTIGHVATVGIQSVQAEAVLPQQYGTPPRGTSGVSTVVPGGVTEVGSIALTGANQAGLVLSPFIISFDSRATTTRVDVTLTQPAPGGGLNVALASDATSVATIPANVTIPGGQTTTSFNITRAGPGVALIQARATLSGSTLDTLAVVTVSRPAPALTGVSPSSAPVGAEIIISGAGFSARSDNNIVGFVRNNALVAVIDPDDTEVVTDASGKPALLVETPEIPSGAVSIVAAVIDDLTGVISDTSAPINFTVVRSDIAAPRLNGVTPAQGNPRDQVTIAGSGFSTTPDENRVTFRQGFLSTPARVIRSTATQLTVEVPSYNISRGPAVIIARRIAPNGASSDLSNALDFTINSDPTLPAKPAITSVVNSSTQQSSGRDGDTIRVQGTRFGSNFYDIETDDLANDEPLISLLLFYQNNQIVNFALPVDAQSGTQLTALIPTGLAAGATQITTVTFDLETGFVSEESNTVNFTITAGSLRRIDEDEPNDSPDTATEVSLGTIVAGRAAKGDPGDLFVRFNDGTTETLVDLFLLDLAQSTLLTVTLSFESTADLDLFILEEDEDGNFVILGSSTSDTATIERLSGTLPAGEYYIAVGAFNGSSRYTLEIRSGPPATFGVIPPQLFNMRKPLAVDRRKD